MKLKCISVKKAILSSLLALFTVTIVGFSNSYQVKAEEAEQYALGCIPDDESVLESLQIAKNSPKAANDSLPRSVDLESKMPSPGNQGQQGSCTAWAVAYAAKSYQENQEHSWVTNGWSTKTEFSPAYLYNQINGGVDKGSNILVAMRTIKEKGICSLYDMPYNQNDYLTQPNTYQNERASNFKISSYYTVKGADAVKAELADGNPVVISIPVYGDFDDLDASNPIYDKVEGTSRGRHAICLIGYDDNKKAFKLINSWGDYGNWGVKGSYYNKYGYGYISYDLFERSDVSSGWGYVMSDAVQHYESNPYEVKALKSINVYSDTELKTTVKTISAGTSIKVKSYIAASNGNPPVLRVEDGYITAKTDMTEKTSEYPVVYEGPCEFNEINIYELGKSIEGSKLRITYISDCEKGERAVGIAARSELNAKWLESSDHISLLSDGIGVESVVEMSYDELISYADLDNYDLHAIIFRDWGLKKNTNIKIELITPKVEENVTEVYNDQLAYDMCLSPYELGKNINGSKIRFTYYLNTNEKEQVLGFLCHGKDKTIQYGKSGLDSGGSEREVTVTFTYEDFIDYLGFEGDIDYFELRNWKIKGTNLKIELLTPAEEISSSTVFDGDIGYCSFVRCSPFELGKNIDNSKIRITFTSDQSVNWRIFGISGSEKSVGKWVYGENSIYSKGKNKETTLVFNYNDFVKYVGIGDEFAFFNFQDWGLSHIKIEVLSPVLDEKANVIFNGKINLTEFTPEQLGKNIDGAKIRITYTANKDVCNRVLAVSGKQKDTWKWVQNEYAFLSKGVNEEVTLVLSYRDFVDYIGIGDNVECFVFQDWGLASDKDTMIELIIPVNVTTLYDDVIEQWDNVAFTPQQLGKDIDGAMIRFTYYSDENAAVGSDVLGLAGKANDAAETWVQSGKNPAFTTQGYGIKNIQILSYDELVTLADIGTDVRYYAFCNWGLDPYHNVKIELITPVQL